MNHNLSYLMDKHLALCKKKPQGESFFALRSKISTPSFTTDVIIQKTDKMSTQIF